MAGLLGNGWDDPQSSAIMALAGGMLKSDLGGGLLGANSAYSQSKQDAAKQQYMQMQMQNMQSEVAQRQAAMQKQQDLMDFIKRKASGSTSAAAPAQMGQLGSGSFGVVPPPAGMPDVPQAAAQPQGQDWIQSLSPSDMLFMKAGGMDPTDVYNTFKPKWENVGGNMVNTNDPKFKGGFVPQVKFDEKGGATMLSPGANGVPQASIVPGSLDAYRQFRQADAGIASANEVVKVYNPATGREEYRPKSQVLDASQPAQPQPTPMRQPPASEAQMRTDVQGGMGADPAAIQREIQSSRAGLATVKDPASRAALQSHIADMERQGAALPRPMAAGQSVNEKLAADAGGQINQSWVKNSYEPTLQSGQSARDLIDTVQVTRQAMENMGKTGWGTQTQAAGAAILNGLGIAPQNAKLFAANAEVFQSKAMERLWGTLNEAKGPQTEGDADRASKTFASLKNTPQANTFILDFAEAKAQRDQMKARFYQEAQPIARQKGDLSEVDREWSRRSPSIFNLPSMQRWAGGVK